MKNNNNCWPQGIVNQVYKPQTKIILLVYYFKSVICNTNHNNISFTTYHILLEIQVTLTEC